jgi:mRNA interferase MazF
MAGPGDVILVPFPFRDRLAERTRPAVVLSADAYNAFGDVVIAAVTSHPPRFPTDYALADWAAANLQHPSTVRMLLATVSQDRIVMTIGRLTDPDWAEVLNRLRLVFP